MKSCSKCDSECLVASDFEECLDEEDVHQTHQKLVCPSQDLKVPPGNMRGSAFHEKVVRHPSSLVHTTNIGAETEIVHIGRKSHNKCTVITMIGNTSQEALWDSGAGRCVISYDCYNSLHPRYRTELFPSNGRNRAENGTFIANKGEYDITLKINDERVTFPFLFFGSIVTANDTWQ